MPSLNISRAVTYIGTTTQPDIWSRSGLVFAPMQTYNVNTTDYDLLIAQTTYFVDGQTNLENFYNIGTYFESVVPLASAISVAAADTFYNVTSLECMGRR
jgi:hypothetical protein